jgi:uncharacterized protein (TIGR02118 family)
MIESKGLLDTLKTLALIKRRPDITRDAFREHYEQVHAPLAIETVMAGTKRYVRNHLRDVLHGEPRFDVVSAFWYQSAESALSILERLTAPVGEAILRDERTFMDKPANGFFAVVEQHEEGDERAEATLRVVVLAAAPGGVDAEPFAAEFEERYLGPLRDAVRDGSWCLHHRVVPVNRDRPDYDVVTQIHAGSDAGLVEWARKLAGTGARVVVATVSEHESELPW